MGFDYMPTFFSREQWCALRSRVDAMAIITVANYHTPQEQMLHGTRKDDPCTPHGTEDGLNGVAARAAERVRTRIDAIATNTMFRVDAHV